jgi:thiamine biosynthesis protein ThiS
VSHKIKVILNGCEERISQGATIQDLITLLNEQDRHLIVECNNFLIPPAHYSTHTVADGDIVEFINPNMGG